MTIAGILRALAFAVTAVLLFACQASGPEDRLDDYLQRLARPLDASIPEIPSPPRITPPRAESLRLDLQGDSLDSLDFLRLRGCALQTTVARRNSTLGRVAPPSQRLLLELAFLREAPACIDKLNDEGRTELAATLSTSIASKEAQLPALIFNATLGNLEYREFWRENTELADYPEDTSSLVVTALEQVTADTRRWLAGDYSADEKRFELALADIARGDGGRLRLALRLQAAKLAGAKQIIEKRLQRGPLCSAQRTPQAAPILRTVAQKYFVGSVQLWSASLNQRYHQLLPPLHALEKLLEDRLALALQSDYASWRRARETEFAQNLSAPAQHVKSLQQLLGSCYLEFTPGATAP